MDFAISVCVFAADEEDFTVRDGEGTAGPERIFHADSEHLPLVLLNFIHFYCVINLLFCTPKKATKSVNEFVSDSTSAEIVPFVFHGGDLVPFVLLHIIFFNRAEALLS